MSGLRLTRLLVMNPKLLEEFALAQEESMRLFPYIYVNMAWMTVVFLGVVMVKDMFQQEWFLVGEDVLGIIIGSAYGIYAIRMVRKQR